MDELPARVSDRLNLRDLGTLPTDDGRVVATGRVIRCGHLVDLPDEQVDLLHALGVRTVLDLRTAPERAAAAGLALPGAEHVWLDVIGESPELGPARIAESMADPVRASVELSDGRAEAIFAESYRKLVSSPSSRAAYATLLRTLVDPQKGPVIFHCTAGKDRTGWAAALLLTVLGVPRDVVLADYLETNEGYAGSHTEAIASWAEQGGDAEILSAVMSARPRYLEVAFNEMETVYGGLQGYLVDGLGLDEDIVDQLRAALLVDRSA